MTPSWEFQAINAQWHAEALQLALRKGWEPFAVCIIDRCEIVYLRRQVSS